jgi:hypothetical protein
VRFEQMLAGFIGVATRLFEEFVKNPGGAKAANLARRRGSPLIVSTAAD